MEQWSFALQCQIVKLWIHISEEVCGPFPAQTTTPLVISSSLSSPYPPSTSQTTPVVSTVNQQLLCYIVTIGGTSGTSVCMFPFTYRGVVYDACTTVNNNGVPWCYTTYTPQDDRLWGNCLGIVVYFNSNYSKECQGNHVYLRKVSVYGISGLHSNKLLLDPVLFLLCCQHWSHFILLYMICITRFSREQLTI